MTITGIILLVLGVWLAIFNHYKPSKHYPQTVKFIDYLLFIVGLVLILLAIIISLRAGK